MRLHLVEIHDLAWCPPSLRDALTDFLSFFVNTGGAYDAVGPLLRAAIERTGARRIIDLCSGAGGPWSRLAPMVGLPVVKTDLYPHDPGVRRVDARAVPPELDGFRTIFTAFHHFRPAEARAILADAVARKQGIGIFEIARRAPREIAIIAFTWLGALPALPFMRPWRLSSSFWTYLPPARPARSPSSPLPGSAPSRRCRSCGRGSGRAFSGPICRPRFPLRGPSTGSSPAFAPTRTPNCARVSTGSTATTGISGTFVGSGRRCAARI